MIMSQSTLLFRFAVIADIQFADIDDAMNFTRTENRGYRATLNHFKTTNRIKFLTNNPNKCFH